MNDEMPTLWMRTLGDDHGGESEQLRRSYTATRKNATVLLNELSHSTPHFTVHDITHVDALWDTANMLCGSAVSLTPAEAYVLGCAFLLHDAAMGAASYQESIPVTLGMSRWHDLLSSYIVSETGTWPSPEELAEPDESIVKACTVHAIRDLHAAHAAKLVDQAWVTSAGNELHLIEDLQLREWYGPLIGDLAASHWWSVDKLERHFRRERNAPPWQPPGWTIDPLKLACLLRLADATQIDSRRAPTFLFALRRPEGHSREHWRFQEHIARPRLQGDRVTYNAARAFKEPDADAWWLALDYLRGVDAELKKVDALLHDLNRSRFEGRAVAGVDSPERFVEYFPVHGWSPVDARIAVSDVPGLVETLGGEQLYGKQPEVALRELLQNAQDATLARKALDSDFADDEIVVTLTSSDIGWTLEVADRGVGMDEDILTSALLDFGRTGWNSDTVRKKFAGLVDGGFRPKGRFGIGFFSVFMLGDDIEIVTRRLDSAPGDARRLKFRGVRVRPILAPISEEERVPIGTRIRIRLKVSPYDLTGIFSKTEDDRLDELIQQLCPERSVAIRAVEASDSTTTVLPPVDLRTAEPAEVFDILYPPVNTGGTFAEAHRRHFRSEFIARATEMLDEQGARIGLAAFGMHWYWASAGRVSGAVLLNGFRSSDKHFGFVGYVNGRPSRASRDRSEIAGSQADVRNWLNSQEYRLRELNLLTIDTQANMGYLLQQAHGHLPPDFSIAFASEGFLKFADAVEWLKLRDEVIFAQGWPLRINLWPYQLMHSPTGKRVQLPENWLYPLGALVIDPFDNVFPLRRDQEYEYARHHKRSWQKTWWRVSDNSWGLLLKQICIAWDCGIGDILAPVEKRNWDDTACVDPDIGEVPVWRLNKPTRQL